MKAGMAKNQPIPRSGITDDIARAAVFLASDDSTFINGHDLVVDGGLVGGRMWTPIPHPEEARSAVSKGRLRTPRLLPTLRDASLRDAPQGEVVV